MTVLSAIHKSISLLAVVVIMGCCLFIMGCGDTSDIPQVIAPTTPVGKVELPSAPKKVTFTQLVLMSPVKVKTDSQGITTLTFKYASADGSVYLVQMPQAMSQGAFTGAEWDAIFSLYNKPTAVAKKRVIKKNVDSLNDFPFIAPKSVSNPTSAYSPIPALPGQNMPVPQLPSSGPTSTPAPVR